MWKWKQNDTNSVVSKTLLGVFLDSGHVRRHLAFGPLFFCPKFHPIHAPVGSGTAGALSAAPSGGIPKCG